MPLALPVGAIRAAKVVGATYSVYHGIDAAGVVRYVGITARDPSERFAEHLAAKDTGKDLLTYRVVPGSGALTRSEARVVEQTFINQFGLQKNAGTLINKINSISASSRLSPYVPTSIQATGNILTSFAPVFKRLSQTSGNIFKF